MEVKMEDNLQEWWRIKEQRFFQIQTDKLVMVNQLDTVVVDRLQMKLVAT